MPRNRESEPRVTISGGRFSFVISTAFSDPARHPNSSAAPAPPPTGQPPSRHSTPNTTAASPMMEPTDKSIPPVIIIGVSASASKPSSTLRRTTSKKFDQVKKFSPMAANMASSTASASASTHSPLGNQTSRHGLCWLSMFPRADADRVQRNRRQNDGALHCPLPIRAESQEGQRRADHAQQQHSQQRSGHGAAPANNGHAADYHGGDHFQFQPDPGVARDLQEARLV